MESVIMATSATYCSVKRAVQVAVSLMAVNAALLLVSMALAAAAWASAARVAL
jgi:hypothetical protein